MLRITLIAIALTLAGSVPARAKTGSTWFTDADVKAIRERAKDSAYAKEVEFIREKADEIASKSDDEIWAMVTDADLPRAINVRFGTDCPVHGKAIFTKGGHYPWMMSADHPFKVQCPVGMERYPTNDFAAHLKSGRNEKLDTHQKYVDDGNGWIDENGQRFFFVAYYNFWKLWRMTILEGLQACAKMYVITGDEHYAHKAGVLMARISDVYPQMDWSKQGVSDGKWPSGWTGRINDRIWETMTAALFARSYDAIFPALASDKSLKEFAASKGIDDVRLAIEQNILQNNASDIINERVHGNRMELSTLAVIALVLQNDDPKRGATTQQMVDWILRGKGELEFTFYNGFDRDGIGGESSPMYSSFWNDRFVETAGTLSRLGIDITKDRKWLRLAKGPAELRILDYFNPRIGDTGGGLKGEKLLFNADLLKFGVAHFDDADSAKWLMDARPTPMTKKGATTQVSPLSGELLFKQSAPPTEKLRELAGRSTYPRSPYTRDLGGYGLAVLELDNGASGSASTGAGRTAAWMYYGGPDAAHQHRDRLTLGYYAFDREIFTEMGYPSHWGPSASYWTQNTPSHYCVMVDEQSQPSRRAGHLLRFADLEGLKLASADGTIAYTLPSDPAALSASDPRPTPPKLQAYRRTIALLDTGEQSTLLIDAFLVQGGKTHDYSFHGLPWGKLTHDLKLTREQNKGTLLGESIEFGAEVKDQRKFSGYQYMDKPRWYEPTEVTHLSWRNDAGVNQETWFPNFGFDEVIVADTTPPIKPGWPANIPYVLLRHRGDDLTSLFVGITEAHKGTGTVKSVSRITASDARGGGATVEMTSGATWRIYVNESGQDVSFADGAAGSLPFAAQLVKDGKVARTQLVGVGTFKAKDATAVEQVAVEATVGSVDYGAGTIIVEGSDAIKPGSVVRAVTGPNSQSYTIRLADGGTLGFGEIGLLTGRFEGGWDEARKQLVSRERTGGFYNQFMGKSFVGMSAVNEDLSAAATIAGHDLAKSTFTIDAPPDVAAKFRDINGDGRSYLYITDISPGTKLIATPAQTITR